MLSIALGPFAIPKALAVTYLGFIGAWAGGWWLGRRHGASPESALFNIAVAGIISARCAFVVLYLDSYSASLLSVLDIRDGGFLPLPGIVAALLVTIFYVRRCSALRLPLLGGLGFGAALAGTSFVLLYVVSSPQKIPDLHLYDLQGNLVALQDFSGKPVVINLWATWCPHCRREMPTLQHAQARYPDIYFVLINQGESQQQVEQFYRQENLHFEHMLLDSAGKMGQAIGSLSLPTTLFYDAAGHLKNSHLGGLSQASLQHALQAIHTPPQSQETP